ncbi:hypothetical protein EHS25_006713 [Saitozyma podzolica]|uniref:Uncharacterized protein n=1 Tax=Saitozyma podzolica TaxID=1890683 RepID=A0A427YSK6_9TREE|nr:hypothetical protein EHS25_006713 [Saitozyma podzolica]
MLSTSKLTLVAALLVGANALTINTPASLIECEPTSLSWTDGTEPFYIAAIPGGDVSGSASISRPQSTVANHDPRHSFMTVESVFSADSSPLQLENIATATSSPYTWTVDLASGTNITIKITDSTGTIAYSSAVVIQSGTSTSCLNSSASATSDTTAASTSGSSSGSSTAAASAAAASGSSSSTSKAASAASGSSSSTSKAASASGSTTSSSASSSSSSSAANRNVVTGGALALAGLVAAAFAA